jgi:hypothetical protein
MLNGASTPARRPRPASPRPCVEDFTVAKKKAKKKAAPKKKGKKKK